MTEAENLLEKKRLEGLSPVIGRNPLIWSWSGYRPSPGGIASSQLLDVLGKEANKVGSTAQAVQTSEGYIGVLNRQDQFGNPLPPAQLDKAGAVIPTPPPPRSNMNTVGQAFNRMAGGKSTVPNEITFGRFTFKGGKIFGFDGREIPRAKADLTVGEAQALQESLIPVPAAQPTRGQAAGGGGMGGGGMGGGGGGGGTGAGPRIGGTSVNVSAVGGAGGFGGGGFSQIQNPLIREAARRMEFNQWMYGSPYSPLEQEQRAANERALAEAKRFQDFAKSRGDLNDPVSAAQIQGLWRRQEAKRNQEIQGARIGAQFGYGSKEYGDWQAGQRAVYDPRRD